MSFLLIYIFVFTDIPQRTGKLEFDSGYRRAADSRPYDTLLQCVGFVKSRFGLMQNQRCKTNKSLFL